MSGARRVPSAATPVVGTGRDDAHSARASRARLNSLWSRHPALTVTVVATVLAVLATYPLIGKLSSAIYGGPGDSTYAIYLFWWWSHALTHGLPLFHNTLLGAPFGAGWDDVPFTVLQVGLLGPLSIPIGPTAAYNLFMLSSFPLTALFGYLLARRLGIPPLAAAFTALAFAFMPYHLDKATGHLNQTHMELFPGMLLFLVRWRQGGSRWNLLGAGAVLGLATWTDFYFPFIAVFMVLGFFAISFLLPASGSLLVRLRGHVAAIGAVGLTAAVFLPFAVLAAHRPSAGEYRQSVVRSAAGLGRPLFDLDVYSARPWEFLLPWHANPLVPAWVQQWEFEHIHHSNFVEQSLFLGYTAVLLATIALIASRHLFAAALGTGIAAEGMILALPPRMTLGSLHVFGPSYWLHGIVPFFRVYARFGILVMLGVSILAGLGFAWLQARLRAHKLGALTILPFALLAVEFNNQPPHHVVALLPAPAAYHWLQAQPDGILVEYPLAAGDPVGIYIQTFQYMFYQQVHIHPIFNSDAPTSKARQLARQFEPYYRPGVAAELQSLGIRYLFVHRRDYAAAGYQQPRTVAGMHFVHSFDDIDVFLLAGEGRAEGQAGG